MKSDFRIGKGKGLADEVYRLTLQIPEGRVSTYGAIATALRKEGASRAVGKALHLNPDSPRIPCHRVVYRDGRVGGYAKGIEMKTRLLRKECVSVEGDRIQNFERMLFVDFT
ncbi:MAG: MGMT family protein [Nitrososphaerales archaeon]